VPIRTEKTMGTLVARRLYLVHARNLVAGVWNPEIKGFMGIREKFGHRYLEVEDHVEAGTGFPTAYEKTDTGIDLPPEIGMHRYEPRACANCGRPVEWTGPPAPAPWRHVDPIEGLECGTAVPQVRQNEPLYQWLETQEAALGVK